MKTVLVRRGRKTVRVRETVVYGRGTYLLVAGSTASVLVALSAAGQSAVAAAAGRGVSVKATVSVAGGVSTVTTITLRLVPKKPVKKPVKKVLVKR